MITCIHCRQLHSDERHECLEDMSAEEVMALPETVTSHLLQRQYRARFLQALFEDNPYEGLDRSVESRRLANEHQDLTRAGLVDAIALARRKIIRDVADMPALGDSYVDEFERMAESMVERLFPETDQG